MKLVKAELTNVKCVCVCVRYLGGSGQTPLHSCVPQLQLLLSLRVAKSLRQQAQQCHFGKKV